MIRDEETAVDNDDQQVGRILSRREVLALLGAGGVTLLAACGPQQTGTVATQVPTTAAVAQAPTTAATEAATAVATLANAEGQTAVAIATEPTAQAAGTAEIATVEVANTAVAGANAIPACVVRPEVTEGPYYVDEQLNRADVRSDTSNSTVKEGALLALTFSVSQVTASGCTPYAGAVVDIWHCDAAGIYSGVSDRSFNTKGQNFLRGYQVTDANGQATFTTIYPGWYPGRAVHIHFKIRTSAADHGSEFTSQLFFDDVFSDQVFTQAAYAGKGQRTTLNSNDGIYDALLLLNVTTTDQGYAATFPIGVDLS